MLGSAKIAGALLMAGIEIFLGEKQQEEREGKQPLAPTIDIAEDDLKALEVRWIFVLPRRDVLHSIIWYVMSMISHRKTLRVCFRLPKKLWK